MYSFEHKDTEDHPVKDTAIVLGNVAHRVKDCLEHLLEEDCWDSQDVDAVKDCIEILWGIRKFNFYMKES
nr:MAG TPA_asm: hypothetical protein [Caudoviricetes sp.]